MLFSLIPHLPIVFVLQVGGGTKKISGVSLKRAFKMKLSCVEITYVGHSSQKLWPKIVFWEIAHCILHCKVGWCVTTLKTKKKTQKIKVVSWAISPPKIVG